MLGSTGARLNSNIPAQKPHNGAPFYSLLTKNSKKVMMRYGFEGKHGIKMIKIRFSNALSRKPWLINNQKVVKVTTVSLSI